MLLPVLALGNLVDLLILVSCLKETARKHHLLSSHFLGSCCGPCGGPWRGLGRGKLGKDASTTFVIKTDWSTQLKQLLVKSGALCADKPC